MPISLVTSDPDYTYTFESRTYYPSSSINEFAPHPLSRCRCRTADPSLFSLPIADNNPLDCVTSSITAIMKFYWLVLLSALTVAEAAAPPKPAGIVRRLGMYEKEHLAGKQSF